MNDKILNTVLEIDKEIRKHDWFEFTVLNYDGYKLTIAGSFDFSYYHNLEIFFEDILFFSGYFNGWIANTSNPTFLLPENENEMNRKYQIENGYQLFVFKANNYENDIVIAAKNIKFNTDTVYYYERNNLKENERLASFVKKENVK
jgi:hypothetical protein